MEMKRKIVFMVMMLTIGNLIVESEVINKDFRVQDFMTCFKLCLNICLLGPVRDKLGCFGNCKKSCGRQSEVDCINLRCVSDQDPSKFWQ